MWKPADQEFINVNENDLKNLITRYEVEGEENKAKAEKLNAKLAELKKELFNLRFQHAINQLDNPHKITDVKHDIARVMTVLREKNA